MTTMRLYRLVCDLSPSQFSQETILMWISQAEQLLACDVLEIEPELVPEITELSQAKMIVPHPYDRVYLPYVQAMIANAQGETDLYQNYIEEYNTFRDDWAQWVLNGQKRESKWYVSAYQLACEQGFNGTIQQWLDSHKGEPGDDLIIKGHYDTLDELEAAHPTGLIGDYYEVGTDERDSVVFYWDEINRRWYGIDLVAGQKKAQEAAKQAIEAVEAAEAEADLAKRARNDCEFFLNLAGTAANNAREAAEQAGRDAAAARLAKEQTGTDRQAVQELQEATEAAADRAAESAREALIASEAAREAAEDLRGTIWRVAWTELEVPEAEDNRGVGYATKWQDGGYQSSSTSNWKRTGLVDVSGFEKIKYQRLTTSSDSSVAGMAFYDENGTFLKGERMQVKVTEDPGGYVESVLETDGAKWARFTENKTRNDFWVKGMLREPAEGTYSENQEFVIDKYFGKNVAVLHIVAEGTGTAEIRLERKRSSPTGGSPDSYYATPRYSLIERDNRRKTTNIRMPDAEPSALETHAHLVVDGSVAIRSMRVRQDTQTHQYSGGVFFNAHGKCGGGYPANTMAAYEGAAKMGFRYCITIPKLTGGNELVCIHDDTIGATARYNNGNKLSTEDKALRVDQLTYNQLLDYDFGRYRGADYRGERIPLLEDFFRACAQTGMHPVLSVHPPLTGQWERIKAMAKTYGLLDKLGIKADPDTIETPMQVLRGDIESYTIDSSVGSTWTGRMKTLVQRYDIDGKKTRLVIEYKYSVLTKAIIDQVLAEGFRCGVYNHMEDQGTIMRASEVKRLMSLGVTEFSEDYIANNGLVW